MEVNGPGSHLVNGSQSIMEAILEGAFLGCLSNWAGPSEDDSILEEVWQSGTIVERLSTYNEHVGKTRSNSSSTISGILLKTLLKTRTCNGYFQRSEAATVIS